MPALAFSARWAIALAIVGRKECTPARNTSLSRLRRQILLLILHRTHELFQPLIQRQNTLQKPLAGHRALVLFRPEAVDDMTRTILRDTHAFTIVAALFPDLFLDLLNHVHGVLLS